MLDAVRKMVEVRDLIEMRCFSSYAKKCVKTKKRKMTKMERNEKSSLFAVNLRLFLRHIFSFSTFRELFFIFFRNLKKIEPSGCIFRQLPFVVCNYECIPQIFGRAEDH